GGGGGWAGPPRKGETPDRKRGRRGQQDRAARLAAADRGEKRSLVACVERDVLVDAGDAPVHAVAAALADTEKRQQGSGGSQEQTGHAARERLEGEPERDAPRARDARRPDAADEASLRSGVADSRDPFEGVRGPSQHGDPGVVAERCREDDVTGSVGQRTAPERREGHAAHMGTLDGDGPKVAPVHDE